MLNEMLWLSLLRDVCFECLVSHLGGLTTCHVGDNKEEFSKFSFDQTTEGQDFVFQAYPDCLLQIIKTEAALRVQDPCDHARKVATLLCSSNHVIAETANCGWENINDCLKSLLVLPTGRTTQIGHPSGPNLRWLFIDLEAIGRCGQ